MTDLIDRLYERHCQGDDLCGEAQAEIERNRKEIDSLIEMLRRERVWILAAQGRKEALEEIANE